MDDTRRPSRVRIFCVAIAGIGFWTAPCPDRLPSAPAMLRQIGVRLSHSCSETELTALAMNGPALLEKLEPNERAALGHCYLRFQAAAPVVVDVAAPARAVPFWLGDDGFALTGLRLHNQDGDWVVYRKTFSPGWIGLGVNNLDYTPSTHYVVFVRRSDSGPATDELVTLDATDKPSWKKVTAAHDSSAASDSYKPFGSIPPELVGSVMLQPAHGDRHSTLLATGRVWKSRVVSTPMPDQVAISFGADPARSLVWTWRTSVSSDASILRLAKLSADATIRTFTGTSSTVEVKNLLNDPVIRRHRVEVVDLEPDTTYAYSLGEEQEGHSTPWRAIRTAPGGGRDFQFLYLGDAQTGLEGWGRLLAKARERHPRAAFLILGGDLVDRGNERTNWDHFFLRAAGVFDQVPLMPCVGNHEYLDMGPKLYRAFFELPRNGPAGFDSDLIYHFECGDAFFAVLDSTLAVSGDEPARRQAAWLDDALAKTRATWKFVAFHHPVYPSHPWRDTPALRRYWVPVFDRHHVDMVLQGHDHAYLRTYPMLDNRRALSPERGTVYVIAVSGDKFVDQPERDYIEVGRTHTSTYQTIDIQSSANRLIYRAWTEDGSLVDEMTIGKGPKGERESWSIAGGVRSPESAKR